MKYSVRNWTPILVAMLLTVVVFAANADVRLNAIDHELINWNFVSDIDRIGDYAFMATRNTGLIIIDVSDPAAPERVGWLPHLGDVRDLDVSGSLACVAAGDSGMHLIDVLDPTSPTLLSTLQTEIGGWNAYGRNVALGNGRAFVSSDKIYAVDVTNTYSPEVVDEVTGTGELLAGASTLFRLGTGGVSILDQGNLQDTLGFYAVSSYAVGLSVVDTTLFVGGQYLKAASISNIGSPNELHSGAGNALLGVSPVNMTVWTPFSSYAVRPYTYDETNGFTAGTLINFDETVHSANAESDSVLIGHTTGFGVVRDGEVIYDLATPGMVQRVDAVGTIAAIADDDGGIQVLSYMTDGSLVPLSSWPTNGTTYLKASRVVLSEDATMLYVLGTFALEGGLGTKGVVVLSLADPTSPTYVDFEPRTTGINLEHSFALDNDYAWYADGEQLRSFSVNGDGSLTYLDAVAFTRIRDLALGSGVLYVYDQTEGVIGCLLSDPATPTPIDTLQPEEVSDVDNVYMEYEDGTLVVAAGGSLRELHVIDATSPIDMREVGSVSIPSPMYVSLHGKYVAVPAYSDGVRLYDISAPEEPVQVYSYNSAFAWGTKLIDNRLLIADYFYLSSFEIEEVPVNSQRDDLVATLPRQFSINTIAPNPFNASTTVTLNLPRAGTTEITLYNILGQSVRSMLSGQQNAGMIRLHLDGSGLTSGTYYLNVTFEGETQTRPVVLLK